MPVQSPLIWILLIFSIWMLADAMKRRAGWFWYLVILLAPLGAVIYFVAIKLPARATGGNTVPPASGDTQQLSTPFGVRLLGQSLQHADQMEAAEQYDKAMAIYDEALQREPGNLQALHGAARCELGLGHPQQAVTLLEKVLNADREFANYGAALDYADALWLAGQQRDAVELLRGLVNTTERINHRLALAHYLAESGDLNEARAEVQRAIDGHAQLPSHEQLRQQRWLERATQMLNSWQQREAENGQAPRT